MTRHERGGDSGFMMVALLVAMAIMAVSMLAILPAWNTLARREREAELVFRGEQYARAIMLFQRQYAGSYPPNVDALVTGRFLRKKYKDPITNDDFRVISVGEAVQLPATPNGGGAGGTAARAGGATQTSTPAGRQAAPGARAGGAGSAQQSARGTGPGNAGSGAGIMGVTSKNEGASLRIYKGGDHYNQWLFIATLAQTQAGGRGAQNPGQNGRGGPAGPRGGQGGANGGRGANPGRGTPFGQPPAPPPGPATGRGRF
jgi:type II secretory pathway pseudopilin PulG